MCIHICVYIYIYIYRCPLHFDSWAAVEALAYIYIYIYIYICIHTCIIIISSNINDMFTLRGDWEGRVMSLSWVSCRLKHDLPESHRNVTRIHLSFAGCSQEYRIGAPYTRE